MPKKQQEPTALRPRSHRQASSAVQESGLIAKPKRAPQSVRTKSALDNRSHRTTDDWVKGERVKANRGAMSFRTQ